MHKLDEHLQHAGIQGMKWGVRRNRNQPGGADGKEESVKAPKKGLVKTHLNSLKRERDWNKVIRNVDNLSTTEINSVARRVGLENELKRLAKTPMAKKSDKQEYLRRGDMSDAELTRKVTRLRAKDSLHRSVKEASQGQREFGQRVTKAASTLAFKYAVKRKLGPDDFISAAKTAKGTPVKDLKNPSDQIRSDLQKAMLTKISKGK